jgi:hypothetical protein
MEAIAIALFILLFGAAAIGKDIDIIHISTPQKPVIQQEMPTHPPLSHPTPHEVGDRS